jgi:hypothetical protein
MGLNYRAKIKSAKDNIESFNQNLKEQHLEFENN